MDIKKILEYSGSPRNQFIAGFLLNILLLTMLLSVPVTSFNVMAPVGRYAGNIWGMSDVHTYINPAIVFSERGVFFSGSLPEYHRTIGYPLFLSIFIRTAGPYWNIAVLFFQALLFAFIYPVIFHLIRMFFPAYKTLPAYTFLFLIIAGTFIPYTAFLYTDTMFALTFLAGMLFCIMGIEKNSVRYIALELLLIGYAAEVRPTLALFPVLNILLIIYFSRQFHGMLNKFAKKTMVISTILLLILCNGPSIRNYMNYGIFMSTDVLHNNLVRYLAKHVMIDLGREEEYKQQYNRIIEIEKQLMESPVYDASSAQLLKRSLEVKDSVSHPILEAHPFLTIKWIAAYGLYNSFDYHWGTLFNFGDMHWHKDPKFHEISKLSIFLFAISVIVYIIIYYFFIYFIIEKIKENEFCFIAILLLMFLPFLASSFGGGGARMRLSVEWMIFAAAILQMSAKGVTFKSFCDRFKTGASPQKK